MKYLVKALCHPSDYQWLALRPWQRHSLVLAVAGQVYLAIGLVYLVTEPTPVRVQALQFALHLAPLPAWGSAWCLVGILALISSRWPPASKTWGYSAMSGLAACWGAMYVVTVPLYGAPWSNLIGALVWFLLAFLWWAIAGLSNPDDLIAMVDEATNGDG